MAEEIQVENFSATEETFESIKTSDGSKLFDNSDDTNEIDSKDLTNGTSTQPEKIDILGNGQLLKKILKAGKKGTRPMRLDLCVVDVVGRFEDGTIIEEHVDFEFHLGDVELIQGLDLAIALMDNEEEAEIEVNSRFAYGTLGRKQPLPEIPPNTKLIYNVKLKSSKMEDDIDNISVVERRNIGNKKRERGNWWFSREEATLAIQCYRRALEYLSPSSTGTFDGEERSKPISDSDLQTLLEDAIKVYNNLAAAQIKTEAFDAALKSVDNVLRCQPQNIKALFRKGKILHSKGEHAAATAALNQALKVDPENKAVKQELLILKQKNERDSRHEKNLYRKMLGNSVPKQKEEKTLKKKSQTKFMWSLVGGSVAAVIGLIAYKFIS